MQLVSVFCFVEKKKKFTKDKKMNCAAQVFCAQQVTIARHQDLCPMCFYVLVS
jgi:hypothetical protein